MPTITTAGAIPTPLADLNAQLIAVATGIAPGLTANLPGTLIEDVASTDTGALSIQDQAAVDLLNGISPLTANPSIVIQLGKVYGVQQGIGSNTSVYVTFTGTPGFLVNQGFLVGDGTYQYSVQDSTPIPSGGVTAPVYCLATTAGTWAVPVNTVTSRVSSVPSTIALTFTNASTGVPGAAAQTIQDYQAQVIQAGLSTAQGTPQFVKTQLQQVSGVQARLISFRQTGGGWQAIVGGGDPYSVAGALYLSMPDINILQPAATDGTTETVAIYDFPDTYNVTFVVPALQTVGLGITWNTIATANFVAPAIVTAAVQPAMVAYINSITVGQSISLLQLQDAFITAVSSFIPESDISKLQFVVTINGTIVSPATGSVLIAGDPESYFFTATADIAVNQG